MSDVQPVASILLGFRVMRGTAEGPRFVRKLHPEPGVVDWTESREDAVLFADRGQAAYVQRCIVLQERRCAAVVHANPNDRAVAELNARAEW